MITRVFPLTLREFKNFSYNSIANFNCVEVIGLCLNPVQSSNQRNSTVNTNLHIHTMSFDRFQYSVNACSLLELSAISLLTRLLKSHQLQITFNFISIWDQSNVYIVTNTVLRIERFNLVVVDALDQANTEFLIVAYYHIAILSQLNRCLL